MINACLFMFLVFLASIGIVLKGLSYHCWARYITYAKEDEAVRCIQAVHNFVLDGKSLR